MLHSCKEKVIKHLRRRGANKDKHWLTPWCYCSSLYNSHRNAHRLVHHSLTFCALDIWAVGVIGNLFHSTSTIRSTHPHVPSSPSPSSSVQMESCGGGKEGTVAGHGCFHHLPATHAWLRGLCKLEGLHHLYWAPSEIKRQATAS